MLVQTKKHLRIDPQRNAKDIADVEQLTWQEKETVPFFKDQARHHFRQPRSFGFSDISRERWEQIFGKKTA